MFHALWATPGICGIVRGNHLFPRALLPRVITLHTRVADGIIFAGTTREGQVTIQMHTCVLHALIFARGFRRSVFPNHLPSLTLVPSVKTLLTRATLCFTITTATLLGQIPVQVETGLIVALRLALRLA